MFENFPRELFERCPCKNCSAGRALSCDKLHLSVDLALDSEFPAATSLVFHSFETCHRPHFTTSRISDFRIHVWRIQRLREKIMTPHFALWHMTYRKCACHIRGRYARPVPTFWTRLVFEVFILKFMNTFRFWLKSDKSDNA